jgi:hypothetical protein
MKNKLVFLVSFGIIALLPFATYPFTLRDGAKKLEFDKIPEHNKKRVREIVKNFGENVDVHQPPNRPYNMIIRTTDTLFNKRIKRDLDVAETLSTYEGHLGNKNGAIKKWEILANKICNEAGYPSNTLYSLKLDTNTLSRDVRVDINDQKEISSVTIVLQEYYNDVFVWDHSVIVAFYKGKLDVVNFHAAGIAEAKVENTIPKYSFDVALEMCLKKLNVIPKEKPQGEINYYLNTKNNTLALCWRFLINSDSDVRYVWINSVSGEIEYNVSICQHTKISGHVYGIYFPVWTDPNNYPNTSTKEGVESIDMELLYTVDKTKQYTVSGSGGSFSFSVTDPTTANYAVSAYLKNNSLLVSKKKADKPYYNVAGNTGFSEEICRTDTGPSCPWYTNYTFGTYAETNVFHYLKNIYNYFNKNWSKELSTWSDPQISGSKQIRVFTREATNEEAVSAVGGSFIRLTENSSSYAMTLYHEFTHIITYGSVGDIFIIGENEEKAIGEAISDYVAVKCANSNGKYVGFNVVRNLDNRANFLDPKLDPDENYHDFGTILGGALFDFDKSYKNSDDPDVCIKLLYSALLQMKRQFERPYSFSKFFSGMLLADEVKNKSIHVLKLCECFLGNHGIAPEPKNATTDPVMNIDGSQCLPYNNITYNNNMLKRIERR